MAPSPPTPENPAGIERLIAPEACRALRAAIAECDGDEVFFVGRVDAESVVVEVEPCTYGNREAVPVIESMARPGNVVIHNHPSGDLRPSDADLEVAARMGNLGVGSYIVNNTASDVRIIVRAMAPRERVALDVAQLEGLLDAGGPLSQSMPNYEHRPEQLDMLRTVADAFNDDGIAIIEAGTGTGKSLAYLLPSIHWAKTNGEKVVVSTNTINLQEQLIGKDLPFLKKHLGLDFKAELMKGRGNYLCKRRSGYLRVTPDFFGGDETATQLQAILEWAAKTQTGSLSDLSFIPDSDAWEQVWSDPDNCPRVKCAHYASCHFFEARRRAAAADLIVANHHLLMADLAVRLESGNYSSAAVLPSYKRIVFDEAHNVEDVATQYFGIRITDRMLGRLLGRLVHRERSNLGLLPFVRDRLILLGYEHPSEPLHQAADLIAQTLLPLRFELAQTVKALMDLCARHVPELAREMLRPKREIRLRITPDVEPSEFWARHLGPAIDRVAEQMMQLARGLERVKGALDKLPPKSREEMENASGELKSLATRLISKVNQLKNFYTIGENQCRWIEVYQPTGRGSPPSVRLISLPLDVQKHLNHAIYAKTPTVVMTSATLSVGGRFDFFVGQVGLGEEDCVADVRERIVTLELPTPFDFERQAFVGVPLDMPDPGDRAFGDMATRFLLPILQISRGSAFVLFTSYSQLNSFYETLAPMLQALGYTCLKQGTDNRQTLLARFKNDRTSILFATSSFWEGVDVPGDALKLLVLAKLPFRVPTDPLLQARVERLEAQGIDSFSAYSVPQAVIRFKQGFGRLIRTREDYGAVLILDRRVATKRYGQVFLSSLPAATVHCKPGLELTADLQEFFAAQEEARVSNSV